MPSCDWAWMAEADDDGRLSDDQRSRFDRHVAHCPACAEQVREVKRIRDRLAAIPEPPISDFQHHRRRQSLLARASHLQSRTLQPGVPWRRMLALSAFAASLVAVGAWRFGSRHADGDASAPHYEVTALNDASWTNEEAGATARVTLSRGSAAFHVHKLNPGQKFFVTLPDGEIEVRGTRFVVDIADGRTKYVVVMEGKVAFRQGGGGERLLLAGDRWDAPALAPVAIANRDATAPAPPPAPIAPPIENRAPHRQAVSAPLRASVSRHVDRAAAEIAPAPALAPPPVHTEATAPSAASHAETPPSLFARGVSAFRAGRYSEAEALWQQFAGEHPQDPRIEDIAFLRAVARARVGDTDGAAALARAYLERFPRGMRRKEAEALTRHASQ